MRMIASFFDVINNGLALSVNLLVGQTTQPVYASYFWG